MRSTTSVLALAVFLGASATTAAADVIDNGTVQLGVNPEGNLIDTGIGLTFLPTGGEALAPGCDCEGWGVADMTTGEFGMAGEVFGDANLSGATLTVSGAGTDAASTGDSAVSTVDVNDGDLSLQMMHEYTPSPSDNLYQVDVTMTNMGTDTIGDLTYRRAMDWDVPPTEFSEFVTIQGWPATALVASSDNGFVTGDPNVPQGSIDPATVDTNFVDSGPLDHGAVFDFSFGALDAGEAEDFTIYYGAAASEDDALMALADVGAEVYSLGQPSTPGGEDLGEPNTYIFAFAGVGGTPVGGPVGHAINTILDFAHLNVNHHLDRTTVRFDQLDLGQFASNGDVTVSSRGEATSTVNGLTLRFAGSIHEGSVGATTNNVGLDYSANYFGFSADYEIDGGSLFETAIVGAAIGYENFDATRQDAMGTIGGDVMTYSVYAGGTNERGLFGDAQLFYSNLDYTQTRIGTTAVFTSNPTGDTYGARVRGGYNFGPQIFDLPDNMSANLGVYGELTYQTTSIDQYTENNGGVTTSAFSYDNAILAIGSRISYEEESANGTLIASLDIAVMQDLAASDFMVTQTTVGGATNTVMYDGRDELMGRATASVGVVTNDNWFGSIEIGGIFSDDFVQEASVGFRAGINF